MAKSSFHILRTDIGKMTDKNEKISFHYPKHGFAIVKLTTYGNYIIEMNSYDVTEGSFKRMPEYKDAIIRVSQKMVDAFEEEDKAYTHMESQFQQVHGKDYYERKLEGKVPQKYVRKTYDVEKPKEAEIRELLKKEAESYFHGKKISIIDVDKYVNQRCEVAYADRYRYWEEAKKLFDEIESYHEEKENERFMQQINDERVKMRSFIDGEEHIVMADLKRSLEGITIPLNLSLEVDYDQSLSRLDADIILDDGLNVPTTKASILSTGKISIKAKLIREIEEAKTYCGISLIYYLASVFFNASPNINKVGLTLWEKAKLNGLCWVEFDRSKFQKLRRSQVSPVSNISSHYPVLEMRQNRDALTLYKIPHDEFIVEIDKHKATPSV